MVLERAQVGSTTEKGLSKPALRVGAEQKMFESIYKKYWQFGFKTRLYDLMAPEVYLDSLQRAVDLLDMDEKGLLLDAGCGSGLLLRLLKLKPGTGIAYVGTDFLFAGLGALQGKARKLPAGVKAICFQADFTGQLPLRENIFDAAVAHFCVYTMGAAKKRINAIKNLRDALKPDGTLVIVNPSVAYDPGRIIKSSLASLKGKGGGLRVFCSKWLIYPLTLKFGLRYIDSQLKKDNWRAYTQDEFCDEIRAGGFDVIKVENIYADSAYLAVCKPSAAVSGP